MHASDQQRNTVNFSFKGYLIAKKLKKKSWLNDAIHPLMSGNMEDQNPDTFVIRYNYSHPPGMLYPFD